MSSRYKDERCAERERHRAPAVHYLPDYFKSLSFRHTHFVGLLRGSVPVYWT